MIMSLEGKSGGGKSLDGVLAPMLAPRAKGPLITEVGKEEDIEESVKVEDAPKLEEGPSLMELMMQAQAEAKKEMYLIVRRN
jgi:hypothetical protein